MGGRRHWTSEEDEAIINLFQSGAGWAEIASKLDEMYGFSRSSKQCRERWHNHLDPDLRKDKWSSDELIVLFSSYIDIGNKWTAIRNKIPHRSENAIKNQFYSSMRRQFRLWKGHNPQRYQLQKYGSFLATQFLTHLKRKQKKNSEVIKTLADIDPIEYTQELEESSSLFYTEMILINCS